MAEKQIEIEVAIETLAAGGDGRGMYRGNPVYVPKTAAGDTVQARLAEKNSDGYFASLQKVITPGPDRITPPCRFYSTCGSCSLQHITGTAYESWKTERVKTTLARAGVVPEVFDPSRFLNAAGRRRVTFCARKTKTGLVFGYNQSRSHLIEDISHCLVLEPALDKKLQALRTPLADLMKAGDMLDVMLQKGGQGYDLVLTGNLLTKGRLSYDQNEALSTMLRLGITRISHKAKAASLPDPLLGQGGVIKTFGALAVEIPPGGFLQASDEGEAALVETVLDYAGKNPGATADLFCGAGTFTGHLAGKTQRLYTADSDTSAIKALQSACAGHPDITVEKRDLFKDPLTSALLSGFETVVLDPPRAGGLTQAQNLAQSSVKRIIYVSCNPATFARDAKILQEGGYILRRLTLVDQFVYTAHTEIVGLFTRA